MPRRLLPALLLLAGCVEADKRKDGPVGTPVDVSKYPAAPTATAARVDQIGRQLVGASPFLGFEPTFHTLGQSEPEVCHPDSGGLFITQGLVERCQSDAQLAAVLAHELAVMKAEKRVADRPRKLEPMAPLPDLGGGRGVDPAQVGTQALFDKKLGTKSVPPADKPEDRRQVAADILKAAGYDPVELEAVAPLLAEAAKHHKAATTFGGRGGGPRWSN